MSAARKPLTKIVEHEVRDVSFRDITILPDLYQTRATTDVRIVRAYSKAMAEGSVFPPVDLYRTPEPDGSLILADGFHRVAARKSLGFTNVKAVIRPGNEQDAVLFGIKRNLDPDNIRQVTDDDRRHAAAIMIRNEEFRGWSDTEIARRTGYSQRLVAKLRLALRDDEGVPIPERAMAFKEDGQPRGLRPYRNRKGTLSRLAITTSVGEGKRVHFESDLQEAERKAAAAVAKAEAQNRMLQGKADGFWYMWLRHRNVLASGTGSTVGGHTIGGTLVLCLADPDLDSLLREVGRVTLLWKHLGGPVRTILVGFFARLGGPPGHIVAAASSDPNPIEFMTPDELVVALGGTPLDDDEADGAGAGEGVTS